MNHRKVTALGKLLKSFLPDRSAIHMHLPSPAPRPGQTILEMNAKNLALIGIISMAASLSAPAQYRDFTNKDGKAVRALLIDKTDTEATVRTRNGKKFILKISALSDDDAAFVSGWQGPNYTHQVCLNELKEKEREKEKEKEKGKPFNAQALKEKDCCIKIQKSKDDKDAKDTREDLLNTIEFSVFQQRELVQVLEEFVNIVNNKEKILAENSALGKKYSIVLTKFKNKSANINTPWKIHVNNGEMSLEGSSPVDVKFGEIKCNLKENDAEYLLDYLKKIDGASAVREFLRQYQNLNG